MIRAFTVFLIAAAAQAATTNTTLTVNSTATLTGSAATATGTAVLTNGIGSGTFSATLSFSTFSGPYTITIGSSTITGTLTVSASILSSSGTGSATVTGGTGTYAGATGSFPSLTGSGSIGTTGALTLTFTGAGTITTGGTTGPPQPVISSIANNYRPSTAVGSAISPATLFKIQGTNLADINAPLVLQKTGPGLPTTVAGATLTLTVNGVSSNLAIYYAGSSNDPKAPPTQIDSVLPAGTPTGSATLTVAYGGGTSAPFTIQVVPAAVSIASYDQGADLGRAQATNPFATGFADTYYTSTHSVKPGDTITLWGSGLGAIAGDSDTTFTNTPHGLTTLPQIYIGGLQATVTYAGDSGYPGLNQINVTVPTSVLPGCNVSIGIVTGSGSTLAAGSPTAIPVEAHNGTCSDPSFGYDGNNNLSGKATVKTGALILLHSQQTSGTFDLAESVFTAVSGSTYGSNTSNIASVGSCTLIQAVTGTSSTSTTTGLDAGTVSVTGPGGTATLAAIGSLAPGIATAQLPTGFIPASGGSFTFNATGGADVKAFSVPFSFPTQITWTNQAAAATVNRAAGMDVTWTGGVAGSLVEIFGISTSTSLGISGSYFCYAPASAGSFHVPNAITLNLPAGTGSTTVQGMSAFQTFSATGIDLGYIYGGASTAINATYQ